MSMPTRDLHRAVAALEQDLRRWRRSSAVGLLGVVVVAVAVVALRTGTARDIVEARAIVLLDDQGRRRGELLMEENGSASLGLYDETGIRKVRLALDADGMPRLTLAGPTQTRIWLAVNSEGVPEVVLHDQQGTKRIEMTLDRTGAPAVVLSDTSHSPRAVLGVDHQAAPALLMRGEGEGRVSLSVLPDGSPVLGLQDREGNVRFRAP